MQRRAGVADALGQLLTPVDVAEGDVVDAGEHGERHHVDAPLLDVALEVRRRLDAGGEAVRDHDRAPAARGEIGADELHRVGERLLLRAQLDAGHRCRTRPGSRNGMP